MELNLHLNQEMASILQANVKSGLYGSEQEVIYDALKRLKFDQFAHHEMKAARLKALIDEGIKQADAGEVIEYDRNKFMAEIEAEFPIK